MKTLMVILYCVLPGILMICCGSVSGPGESGADYMERMRDFVIDISEYSQIHSPGFIIIPQNGQELITIDGEPDGAISQSYLEAIHGQGREDLLFGYSEDDVPTPPEETAWMAGFLDIAESHGVEVLVTDYCWTQSRVDSSYSWCFQKGYVSFAADSRELDQVPVYPSQPWNVNADPVEELSQARNFLYMINSQQYGSREQFVDSVSATEFDLLILDLFCCGEQLTEYDLEALGTKPSGEDRLVICYMSIGEAEDYRWYWNQDWYTDPPSWLGEENPDWPGNYLVQYWDAQWQSIIFGSSDSYLDMVIDAGFDGVYLDKIDSFENYM